MRNKSRVEVRETALDGSSDLLHLSSRDMRERSKSAVSVDREPGRELVLIVVIVRVHQRKLSCSASGSREHDAEQAGLPVESAGQPGLSGTPSLVQTLLSPPPQPPLHHLPLHHALLEVPAGLHVLLSLLQPQVQSVETAAEQDQRDEDCQQLCWVLHRLEIKSSY